MPGSGTTRFASGGSPAWSVEIDFWPARLPAYSAIVSLRGAHDARSLEAVASLLERLHGDIVVDLSDCHLLDATVMRVLAAKDDALQHDAYRLELLVPLDDSLVARSVKLAGATASMVVHESPPWAFTSLEDGGDAMR